MVECNIGINIKERGIPVDRQGLAHLIEIFYILFSSTDGPIASGHMTFLSIVLICIPNYGINSWSDLLARSVGW